MAYFQFCLVSSDQFREGALALSNQQTLPILILPGIRILQIHHTKAFSGTKTSIFLTTKMALVAQCDFYDPIRKLQIFVGFFLAILNRNHTGIYISHSLL